MRRAVLPGVVAVWIACVALSCSSTDVTLATLPSGDDAQTPLPPRCASIADCPQGTYCDKSACDSPSGTCELFPADCDNEEKPVCGCDGLTYFDHCLRQQYGYRTEAETPGPCPGFTCGGPSNTPCQANTFCAQLGGAGHCSLVAPGNCWVLPAECPPPSQATNLWDSCNPGQHCVDTCDALRMGGSYGRAIMCP